MIKVANVLVAGVLSISMAACSNSSSGGSGGGKSGGGKLADGVNRGGKIKPLTEAEKKRFDKIADSISILNKYVNSTVESQTPSGREKIDKEVVLSMLNEALKAMGSSGDLSDVLKSKDCNLKIEISDEIKKGEVVSVTPAEIILAGVSCPISLEVSIKAKGDSEGIRSHAELKFEVIRENEVEGVDLTSLTISMNMDFKVKQHRAAQGIDSRMKLSGSGVSKSEGPFQIENFQNVKTNTKTVNGNPIGETTGRVKQEMRADLKDLVVLLVSESILDGEKSKENHLLNNEEISAEEAKAIMDKLTGGSAEEGSSESNSEEESESRGTMEMPAEGREVPEVPAMPEVPEAPEMLEITGQG